MVRRSGLPHRSAQGLRKAAARPFAEADCSNQQIKSWTEHTPDAEVSIHTKAADQKTFYDAAGEMLMAHLAKALSIQSDNALKGEA